MTYENVFDPKHICKLFRPCVYTFIREGQPLYVGSSQEGAARFGSAKHHMSIVRDSSDSIEVRWMKTVEAARELEFSIIHSLRPPLNGEWHKGNGREAHIRGRVEAAQSAGFELKYDRYGTFCGVDVVRPRD